MRVFLVTGLDQPDAITYEVLIGSGDVALLGVLNVHEPDLALLEVLIATAWSKAAAAGVVSNG